LEQVFSRVTLAHDTLASKQKREEYDAYLAERDRTQAYERLMAMVEGEGDLGEELRAFAAAAPGATPAAGSGPGHPPPPAPAPAPAPMPAPEAGAAPAPSSTPTAEQERARREALARRLRGQVTGRRAQSTSQDMAAIAAQRPVADPRTAADAVKRMYEERKD